MMTDVVLVFYMLFDVFTTFCAVWYVFCMSFWHQRYFYISIWRSEWNIEISALLRFVEPENQMFWMFSAFF